MAAHPAQAQIAGPAQVEVYVTDCSDKVSQTHEFTYLYKSPQWAIFSTILTSDIDLRRRFLTSIAFFNIIVTAAAAAAVATVSARIFSFSVCAFIILIFGRRLWWCDALSSLLLFDQLKEQRKKSKKHQRTEIP
jgi:hypothetical protein